MAGGFESPGRADLPNRLEAHRARHLGGVGGQQQPGSRSSTRPSPTAIRPRPDLKERTRTRTADGNQEKFGQTVAAGCPQGRKLRSGGFEIEYLVEEPAEDSDLGLVHASRRDGDEWRLTAFAFLGHPEMTAYAYCD